MTDLVREGVAGKGRSLKRYLFLSLFSGALLVFIGTTLAASTLYEQLLQEYARNAASLLARMHAARVAELAQFGLSREELEARLEMPAPANVPQGASITLHRVGGDPDASQLPAEIRGNAVIMSGNPLTFENGSIIRHLQPVMVPVDCPDCANGTTPGELLGVVEVVTDVQVVPPEVRLRYITLFVFFAGLVLLAAGATSRYAVRLVTAPVSAFRDRVDKVSTVKDLVHLDVDAVDLHFRELNELYQPVRELIDKLHTIAVDKDILEFEVRLLGKFIITSEVVRDWREYVRTLLLEINEILPAYALITLFKVGDESYELDIFWYRQPSEASKRAFADIARARLVNSTNPTEVQILHLVADTSDVLPELDPHDIELQTKSLTLDTPRIGGIAGIGVQSRIAQDPVRHIVIDSILTTLVNLVGSVKAIHKYTRDLEYYATRDPLTNLYNQRVFWELLEYEVGRAERHRQPFAVLVVDLDNFKSVNDRYGHDFGDRFISRIGQTMQEVVRQGDILSRYGGDEFALILPDSGREQAWLVAERIRAALEAMVLHAPDGSAVRATSSLGIAMFPEHGTTPRDLFSIADNMMYKAKRGGKNAVSLPTAEDVLEIHEEAGEKARMVMTALEEGRIVPFFQPIVGLDGDGTAIHEVLMRIDLPDRVVTATEFIEIAEGLGVTHRMDYLLMERAFQEAVAQDYKGVLFINVSPRALIVGEFLDRVRRLAADYGIEPGRIVLELTERDTVKNVTLLEHFVMELKADGFKFAIDDFGSGFSSFHYLRRLPIDYLKIEGEFVRNMLDSVKDLALIESMLTLAHGLGIATVAEHVENQPLLDALRRCGADYAQGYHLGMPARRFQSGRYPRARYGTVA